MSRALAQSAARVLQVPGGESLRIRLVTLALIRLDLVSFRKGERFSPGMRCKEHVERRGSALS